MREAAIKVGQKATFDILARCFYNTGIKDLIGTMIDIFNQDNNLILNFTQHILDMNEGEPILELLLDCMDSPARNAVGDLWKWMLTKCKMIERQELAGDNHTNTVTYRFLNMMKSNLTVRAAKAWTRFDKFLELFQAFTLQSPDDVLDSIRNISGVSKLLDDQVSEAHKIGMEYAFKTGLIDLLVEFIFGDKKEV